MIASRYRSIERFILDTSKLHDNGGVEPSSKKDRGIAVVVGRLYVVLVNDVAEAIFGVCWS